MTSVITIELPNGDKGTGFYISGNLVLTCNHVLNKKRKVFAKITRKDEKGNDIVITCRAYRVCSDPDLDYAVLAVPWEEASLPLSFEDMEVGQRAVMLGAHFQDCTLEKMENAGMYDEELMNKSDLYKEVSSVKVILGTSGSPVVTDKGVIGMHWAGGTGPRSHLCFVIPVSKIFSSIRSKYSEIIKGICKDEKDKPHEGR